MGLLSWAVVQHRLKLMELGSVLSAGEITAIYNAGLGGTNLSHVPAIVNPFVKSTSPATGATGIAPNLATVSAVITDGLNAVAPSSVQLRLNGATVPVTTHSPNLQFNYTDPASSTAKGSSPTAGAAQSTA